MLTPKNPYIHLLSNWLLKQTNGGGMDMKEELMTQRGEFIAGPIMKRID